MSIDNEGAKRLIASILKQAMDDCGKRSDAEVFIHSDWCASLCDGLNINHERYVAACTKASSKNAKTGKRGLF